MVKVVHVINGLGMGGAENVLVRVLERVDRQRVDPVVIALGPDLALAERLRAAGVEVVGLGGTGRLSPLAAPLRLGRALRRLEPDVVQTWLYKSDLVGGLVSMVSGAAPVIWSLRQTALDADGSTVSNRVVARLCARLSSLVPTRILCVSDEALEAHAMAGYDRSRMAVIPNGFDLSVFHVDHRESADLRRELGLGAGPLVGLVARIDPQKDHATFLTAFVSVVATHPDAVAVLCGVGCEAANEELTGWIEARGLERNVKLLGVRTDVARITAAFDVAVSSSAFGEGFSNSLGEALACGIPAVGTDTGNAATLLGGVGWVVPPRAPGALAAAMLEALGETPVERAARVDRGLQRIAEYDLSRIVSQYEAVWEEVAACAGS